VDDLRKLFLDLDAYTREVTGAQIDTLQPAPGVTLGDFTRFKSQAKAEAGLTMYAHGRDGELVTLHGVDTITREILPDALVNITFDSAARFRATVGYEPLNKFSLILDFREPPSFAYYNPWDQPTPSLSNFMISGNDRTWVGGVSEKVLSFLRGRKRRRLWLHGATAFNFLNWLIGLPASFWLIYRLDNVTTRLVSGLPPVIRSAFYIYLFLVALFAFRVLIYFLRRVFPLTELEGSRSKAVRATGYTIVVGLLSAFIYAVLKAAFK